MRIELPSSPSWIDLSRRQQEDAHTLTLRIPSSAVASAALSAPASGAPEPASLRVLAHGGAPVRLTLTL